MPDFVIEEGLIRGSEYSVKAVLGIDEVGMGAIAGPMVVAGVILNPKRQGFYAQLNDSKKLSPTKRASLCRQVLDTCVGAWIRTAAAYEIDRDGVAATHDRLICEVYEDAILAKNCSLGVIVDGTNYSHLEPLLGDFTAFVDKADSLSLSVAAASILAKTTRDATMVSLSLINAGYGWERNKGYPTPEHLAGLKKLGITRMHRKSYGPVASIVNRG